MNARAVVMSGLDAIVMLSFVIGICLGAYLFTLLVGFLFDLGSGVTAWAAKQREMKAQQPVPTHGFPVELLADSDGEGTYRVAGVVRATEEEIEWPIEARTRANAIAKAEIRGMVVTKVTKQ